MTCAASAIIAVVLLLSPAALAQAPDPFQSAPGPAAAVPKPAPKPHPQPLRRAEPDSDAALSRAPAQTAAPVAMAVPTPAPPAAPFDGIWAGQWYCQATPDRPAFSYFPVIEIRNNQISRVGAKSNTPGVPGYDRWDGTVGPDGHVLITHEAVGTGASPGGPKLGQRIVVRLNGVFSGDNFTGQVEGAGRDCRVQLTRRR
jgi:hypothetical protein